MSTTQPTTGPEQAAVRKVIYRLAELDGTECNDDMITAANEALKNVEDLARRVENLEAQIETLEERAPDPTQMEYDELEKPDKATIIRSKLKGEAEATNGRSKAEYKDIIRMFDGYPSAGHAYDLMEAAAELDGCNYSQAPDGTKRLTYKAD